MGTHNICMSSRNFWFKQSTRMETLDQCVDQFFKSIKFMGDQKGRGQLFKEIGYYVRNKFQFFKEFRKGQCSRNFWFEIKTKMSNATISHTQRVLFAIKLKLLLKNCTEILSFIKIKGKSILTILRKCNTYLNT